jgi:hypothetical protein
MIIWSGFGILVFVFAFGCSLVMNLLMNPLFGDEYFETHAWPLSLALVVAGALSWIVGNALNGRRSKMLIEKETGREIVLRPNHTLFFVKMQYWGPILIVLALASLFFR